MSKSLSAYRIGSVPYLNARPLLPLEGGIETRIPSELSIQFAEGRFDAALLPIFEALCVPRAAIVDDVAIACRGEVYSVVLAHREEFDSIDTIALDPSSRTSTNLLRCIFAEFYEREPDYMPAPTEPDQARLIIGDPAIAFRKSRPAGWSFVDLGAEWQRWTGMPFVFAAWILREGIEDAEELAALLRYAKCEGLPRREEIASGEADPEFAKHYLARCIRYDLREEEKRAIGFFSSLLHKHGLVDGAKESELRFV